MRVIRALALITLAGAAVLSTSQPVLACDCHDGGPVCEAFWKTPIVSDGHFPWTTIRTDARGGFSFALVSGLSYRLVAEREDGRGGAAALTIDPSSRRRYA